MRLLAISDETCDYMGSIDFMRHFTTIEKPFFIYHPEKDEINHDIDNSPSGILYNSIENMPTEFPLDASSHFGLKLLPFMQKILESDPSKPLKEQGLPAEVERSVIACHGKLTNLFTYISKLRSQKQFAKEKTDKVLDLKLLRKQSFSQANSGRVRIYKMVGHLFDRQTINKVLDFLVGKFI